MGRFVLGLIFEPTTVTASIARTAVEKPATTGNDIIHDFTIGVDMIDHCNLTPTTLRSAVRQHVYIASYAWDLGVPGSPEPFGSPRPCWRGNNRTSAGACADGRGLSLRGFQLG